MFKTVNLLKRRPDLSFAQFVERYETQHAKLGERLLRGSAVHYTRRFLVPAASPTGLGDDQPFDVVMEIWFPDRETWEATMARLSTPEIMAEIVADEETLFDRAANRFFTVDERVSDMGPVTAG